MRTATLFGCLLLLNMAATVTHAQEETGHDWDGSRATPVHRLSVWDEENEPVLPTSRDPMPFSVKNTCGPCHNYDTVSQGLHFNSTQAGAAPGRRGEPWIWVDEKLGTQLPLSYRPWKGVWNPDDLGMTPWRFAQLFGRHSPGGDAIEPDDTLSDPVARWGVSGKVEINCMGCHNGSTRQDLSEWAKQIARENFRWAATAASGLGQVGGMASRMPETWTILDGVNPDDLEFAVPPSVRYDAAQFDSNGRAFFDVTHKPRDQNCLQCHSVSPVESPRWETNIDVHTVAGMQCADCHRNGLDHNMIRGYEGEAAERGDPTVAQFSCKGCHLGVPELEGESLMTAMGGRFGAPRPEHRGIPTVHFVKMSCTACHSGPWPEDLPTAVRTSRANRLGIHGVAQWYTDQPRIGEPVFVKGPDGKLAPHRMMWPAFWGRIEDGKVTPLLPDQVQVAAKGVLDAPEQIGALLGSLTTGLAAYVEIRPDEAPAGEAVFLTPGKVYRLNIDGGLDVATYEGSLTVPETGLWAKDRDGQIVPLVPAFDPNAETLDWAVEDVFLTSLDWLAPYVDSRGEPVATLGNKIYRRTEEGFLDVLERTDSTAETFAWGWRKDDQIVPLVPEFAVRAIADTESAPETLNEEQVALVLGALAAQETGEYVYVSSGKMFRLDESGGVVASEHESAEPYAWALGHNVRPTSQSLGARACTDCHASEAPFYFGQIEPKGPLATASATVIPVRELHGTDEPIYIRTSMFFKWLIIITMALLLLHIFGDLMRRALTKRAG